MNDEMLSQIESARATFQDRRATLAKASPTEDIKHPDRCVSNFDLLLKALRGFFGRDSKSGFFPETLTKEIYTSLLSIANSLKSLPESGGDEFRKNYPQALIQMDSLYAQCLGYGVVTFGFDSKLIGELTQSIKAASDTFVELTRVKHDEYVQYLVSAKDGLSKTTADVEAASKEVLRQAEGRTKEIESINQSAVGVLEGIKSQSAFVVSARATAEGALKEIQEVKTKSLAEAVQLQEELRKSQASGNALLADSQKIFAQIQESSSVAKASAAQSSEARAGISQQLEDIKKFYGEIEKHKTEMLNVKNSSEATLRDLRQGIDKQIADLGVKVKEYNQSTTSIVEKNRELQGKIQDHLRMAVGASLFSSFDKRKDSISWGKWIWLVLLFLSSGGAIWYAYWFATSLREVIGNGIAGESGIGREAELVIIIARIVIAIPIGFVIYFCASQYSRERRAEEEYAFKAAISLSLEPYKTLIESMSAKGKEADSDYIKKLIMIIFENPIKRLYSDKRSKTLTAKQISGVLKEVKPIVETIKSAVGIPPTPPNPPPQ